jgi:hypothetical protein
MATDTAQRAEWELVPEVVAPPIDDVDAFLEAMPAFVATINANLAAIVATEIKE